MKKRVLVRALLTIILALFLFGSLVILIPIWANWFAEKSVQLQFQNYQKHQLSTLAREKEKWESQNIGNYLLQLKVSTRDYSYQTSPGSPTVCLINIHVQDANVLSIIENTCAENSYAASENSLFYGLTTPISIYEIFNTIENTVATPWCGPNGCACDGYFTYSAKFNSDWGYPQYLEVVYNPPFKHPFSFCTLVGGGIILSEYDISVSQVP